MLFLILSLSAPPFDPPAMVVQGAPIEFYRIDRRTVDHMAGVEATFHVVLTSDADTWDGW